MTRFRAIAQMILGDHHVGRLALPRISSDLWQLYVEHGLASCGYPERSFLVNG